jgi:protein-tyrosine phosphatase
MDRVIPLEGAFNFRDFGGYNTTDGRMVKRGILFRSDELSRLSHKDREKLSALNLKTICDLRTPNERKAKPDRLPSPANSTLVSVPIYPSREEPGRLQRLRWIFSGQYKKMDFAEFTREFYYRIAFEHTSQIRRIMVLLSCQNNLPALIHCVGGKDRTGFIAALILLLAGVDRETAITDYLQTNLCIAFRMKRFITYFRWTTFFLIPSDHFLPLLEARRDYLDRTLDMILEKYKTIGEYLLKGCGVTEETVQVIRKILVE